MAWLLRFVGNARCFPDRRATGPLTRSEFDKAEKLLTLNGQQQIDETFSQDQLQLNLQPNEDGVLECIRKVQGFIQSLSLIHRCGRESLSSTPTRAHFTEELD